MRFKIEIPLDQDLISTLRSVIDGKAIQATSYINPSYVIRATRRTYNKKIYKRGNIEIHLTIGKPNFSEREFIRKQLKLGVTFPMQEVQVKMFNQSKRRANA